MDNDCAINYILLGIAVVIAATTFVIAASPPFWLYTIIWITMFWTGNRIAIAIIAIQNNNIDKRYYHYRDNPNAWWM